LKIDHSWNFRNMTSISDNAGDEVVFSHGFHYPKTTCLWLNIKNESHSYFNEAGLTNWERVSIVLSYSLSMRLQLFLLKLLVAKWQWLLILLVPIEYRFHWLPFYQLSTFDYLLWKINQYGIDIMFKNIFTINDVIFSLIQGLFISIFQPSYDRWYVFGHYSHTTITFTVICVRHKFKGYSLKTL